jgi:hypothetical protein
MTLLVKLVIYKHILTKIVKKLVSDPSQISLSCTGYRMTTLKSGLLVGVPHKIPKTKPHPNRRKGLSFRCYKQASR